MPADTHEQITTAHQIICEGPDDIAFFSRLIRQRAIPDIQVGCGRKIDGSDKRCLGTSGFRPRLEALIEIPQPKQRGFLIVTDCDDDPASALRYAQEQFEALELPVPARELEIAAAPDKPSTAIALLPRAGQEGGLETILLTCCEGIQQQSLECVNRFCECLQAENLAIKDQHKLRLRSLIAATCHADPSLGISLWLSEEHRPFSFANPSLDALAHFLTQFAAC